MKEDALVSIVIPFYNAEEYIDDCIVNAIGQSYANIEILFVDDGSTDCGPKKVTRYADKRIRLISQSNQFAGIARNTGLDAAKGCYITFWDVDDFIDPTYIENMVRIAENYNSDIVICNCEGLDDETGIRHEGLVQLLKEEYRPPKSTFNWKDIPDRVFQLSNCWPWDKLYRKDFIMKNGIRFQGTRVLNDAFFCCMCNALAASISICDKILVTHRTTVKGSLESSAYQHWRCAYEMLFSLEEELKKRGIFNELKQSYINLAAGVIAYYIAGNTNPDSFVEAYDDYHLKRKKLFNFSEYGKEYYYNDAVYSIINDFDNMDQIAFLCNRARTLGEEERRERLFVSCLERLNKDLETTVNRKHWLFLSKMVPPGSRVVVYGFGDVGRDYCYQLSDRNDYELVFAIDKDYVNQNNEMIKVISLDEATSYDFDYILISVLNPEVVSTIRKQLVSRGIDEERIIWANPGRM